MSRGATVARLVWYHFCEHVTTDADGKNSYIGVFDNMTVGIQVDPDKPKSDFPLPGPLLTGPFVLAMHLLVRPDAAEVCELRIEDSDGQLIGPPFKRTLAKNPEGKQNLNVQFPRGLPVLRPGILTFRIRVGGVDTGEAQLPVAIRIVEGRRP